MESRPKKNTHSSSLTILILATNNFSSFTEMFQKVFSLIIALIILTQCFSAWLENLIFRLLKLQLTLSSVFEDFPPLEAATQLDMTTRFDVNLK